MASEINLSQDEANYLITLEKHSTATIMYDYPEQGGSIHIPLCSMDKRESFILDVTRNQINLQKGTFQNRGRKVIVLVRLDFGGSPHRNPDDSEIDSPHLHLYREGYGDKWAFPVPLEFFVNLDDCWDTLQDFIRYCNITVPPMINRGLFT
jgi:hypothetical protein